MKLLALALIISNIAYAKTDFCAVVGQSFYLPFFETPFYVEPGQLEEPIRSSSWKLTESQKQDNLFFYTTPLLDFDLIISVEGNAPNAKPIGIHLQNLDGHHFLSVELSAQKAGNNLRFLTHIERDNIFYQSLTKPITVQITDEVINCDY